MTPISSPTAPRFQGGKKTAQEPVNPLKTALMGFLALNPAAAAAAMTSQDSFSRSKLYTQVALGAPELSQVGDDLPAQTVGKQKALNKEALKQQAIVDKVIDLIHEQDPDHPFTRTLMQEEGLTPAQTALAAKINSLTNAQARAILKKGSFAPQNLQLMSSKIYFEAPPVSAATPSCDQVHGELRQIFLKRFHGNQAQANAAANLLYDPQLTALAPDVKLRAALVNLQGTIGEPALASFRRGDFGSIHFSERTNSGYDTAFGANSVFLTGMPKREIWVDNTLKNENFWHLSSLLAHINLHADYPTSVPEEAVSNAFESLLYGTLALENPEISRENTHRARWSNTLLLSLLNSRDAEGNIDLNSPLNRTVLPNSESPDTSFTAYIRGSYPQMAESSPRTPRVDAVLSTILGRAIKGAEFDQNTLNLFKKQVVLDPKKMLRLLGPEVLDTALPLNS